MIRMFGRARMLVCFSLQLETCFRSSRLHFPIVYFISHYKHMILSFGICSLKTYYTHYNCQAIEVDSDSVK
jgi:hypothetical protein